MLRRKNNKRGVRIAYSSETIEKKVKMGRVEFLPGVSHTRVKAHVCKHDPHVCRSIPTYAKPQEQTCVSKNKAAYAASKLCIPGKPSTPKVRPIRKQKILPQRVQYTKEKKKKKKLSKEAEDSSSKSSANHEGSKRFFPSGSHIYNTLQ